MSLKGSPQQGFVLVATLVFITAMLLAAGFFAAKVEKARSLAGLSQSRSDHMVAMHNTLQDMLYRLTRVRPSLHGLGPSAKQAIRLDGRLYLDDNAIRVRLQDQGGLLSLRFVDRVRLGRLLALKGVPLEAQSVLLDSLEDYIDENDLRRLNGAEADDYRASGLPPPANRPIRSVQELKQVFGWAAQAPLWQDPRTLDLFTVSRVTGINPNAAPWEVLATMPFVDEAIARRLIAYREDTPLTQGIMGRLTGMHAEQMQFLIFPFPSGNYLLTLSCACALPPRSYNIRLTPFGDQAPWVLEGIRYATRGPDQPQQTLIPLSEAIESQTIQTRPFSP